MTWEPRPAPYSSHCAQCGAHWRMHQVDGNTCPLPYRPERLDEAHARLRAALVANDPARIFVARGDVQHLGGDPDVIVPPVYPTLPGSDDYVVTTKPRQVRCSWCGGALVTIGATRQCDTCDRPA